MGVSSRTVRRRWLFLVLNPVRPISLVLSERQLEWIDLHREQGSISRSAYLRIVLDRLIEQEQSQAAITRPTDGQ
jgi:Arc/MetJ-type ribon-helix-helix transcriptional regulator